MDQARAALSRHRYRAGGDPVATRNRGRTPVTNWNLSRLVRKLLLVWVMGLLVAIMALLTIVLVGALVAALLLVQGVLP